MFARLRLIVAALLFVSWLGWLGYAVSRKGTVQIVSRAQLAAATHLVIAEISVGPDGVPLTRALVKESQSGEKLTGPIVVRNLASAMTPLPIANDSRKPVAGDYLLPLVKLATGVYEIAGLPRSPGYEAQTPRSPVIYPWTEDVKKQIAQ